MHLSGKNEFIIFVYVVSTLNIIFYPFLQNVPYANFIDEICTLSLLWGMLNIKLSDTKEILICFSILFFYLVYSLIWGANKPIAASYDFVVFLKPFISFYIANIIKYRIDINLKEKVKWLYVILGAYCWFILPYIPLFYTNTSSYYSACILCAVSYLFFSDLKQKDWIIALLLMTPGLFSIKAKFYTQYVLFIFIAFLLKKRIHFNLKWIVVFLILASISIYISWEKFNFYFFSNNIEVARTALYIRSVDIIKDYIPFGPGFGTYGTEAAVRYYSPLYHNYNLDYIWGLGIDDFGTSHSFSMDTFYPVLAQFGIIGIFLFFLFWYKRWTSAKMILKFDSYKLFLFLFLIEAVQNLADNSFSGPIGVPIMMLLGLLLNNGYRDEEIKLIKVLDVFHKNAIKSESKNE